MPILESMSSKKYACKRFNSSWRTHTDYGLMAAIEMNEASTDLREDISKKNALVTLWESTILNDEDCFRFGGRSPSKMKFLTTKGLSTADFACKFWEDHARGFPHLKDSGSLIEALQEFWWQRTEQWHKLFKRNRLKAAYNWKPAIRSSEDGVPLEPLTMECTYGEYPHLVAVRVLVHRDDNDFLDTMDPKEPVGKVIATRDCHPECGRRFRNEKRLKTILYQDRKEEICAVCQSGLAKDGFFQGRSGGSAFDWT